MGEGRERYSSRANNHHQDEEPSLIDGQICWRLSRLPHSSTGPPHESNVRPLWFLGRYQLTTVHLPFLRYIWLAPVESS